jgi:rhodanese-related sulfurtransferase
MGLEKKRLLTPKMREGIPEIPPGDLPEVLGRVTVIDVRRPDEYNGELSHIASATLATLGPDLGSFLKSHDKNDEVVFVCRSGSRSGQATLQGLAAGFANRVNLHAGMILWNKRRFQIDRAE